MVRFFMEVPQWIQIGGVFVGALVAIALAVLAWRRRAALWNWVVELPVAVRATAVAVIVAGGAVASVAGYQVYDFVEHDNEFCTGCHLMEDAYVSFEQSAHTDLGCKACHAQSKVQSARQLYLWVLDRPQEVGPHSPVSDARCSSCHVDENPETWPQVAASLGHRVHFESDDPELGELMCVGCHGVSVHQFTPVDQTCGECHESESSIRLGGMAGETELHCVACHDFLGEEAAVLEGVPEGLSLMPDRAQCQACHSMSAILDESEFDADPHGAVCGACHNPHEQDEPIDAIETCTTCHAGSDTLTIFHTGTHRPIHSQCAECHSAHSWSVEGSECQSCHTNVMGAIDSSGEPGTALQPIALLAMHGPDGGLPPDLLQQVPDTLPRPFLHRQHQGLSCIGCHGSETQHGVVTVRTPEQCAACHHAPEQRYGCRDCHSPGDFESVAVRSTLEFTVWDTARDRELPFDHDRHSSLECGECHANGVMLEPNVSCATCHEAHHRPGAECVLCHQPADDTAHGLEVHLTCTSSGCHSGTVQERPPLTRNLCLACHSEQRDHEPGLDCQTCHMIPDPAPSRPGSEP